jgi:hypothetical protein
MFIDRQVADVAISSEPSIADILRDRRAKRERREEREEQGKTDAGSPTLLP